MLFKVQKRRDQYRIKIIQRYKYLPNTFLTFLQ